jgi:hypothetical protein
VPDRFSTKPDAPRPIIERQLIDDTAASVRASVERRLPHPEPEPHSVSPHLDQAIGKATRAFVGKVVTVLLAGILGTGGAVAYQHTASPPERDDRRDQRVRELERDLSDIRDELAETKRHVRALRDWAGEDQAWWLALEQKRGVLIRQHEGAPPLPSIETTSPIRRRAATTTMTVQSPPPTPPQP